jgi:hypothetical protein
VLKLKLFQRCCFRSRCRQLNYCPKPVLPFDLSLAFEHFSNFRVGFFYLWQGLFAYYCIFAGGEMNKHRLLSISLGNSSANQFISAFLRQSFDLFISRLFYKVSCFVNFDCLDCFIKKFCVLKIKPD